MAFTVVTCGGQRLEMRTGEDVRDLAERNRNATNYVMRKEMRYWRALHYILGTFLAIIGSVVIAYILID
ncbi:MAG: hypothetical protein ABFC85_00130 [Rectinema sp.]